jgi:hypothetical protein
VRKFNVPNARTFSLRGSARLDTSVADPLIDSLLGVPGVAAGGITVTSSQRLPGSVSARGSSAFDGDPTTAWTTGFEHTVGAQWLDVATSKPVTFDHLDLQVVADGRHSVPTQIRIDAGGASRVVNLPPVQDRPGENAVASAPVHFEPLSGNDVRITITDTRRVITTEYYENQPIEQPVAIADVGLPGVQRAALPQQLPASCRTDLLSIDGSPVGVRLSGTTADASALHPIDVSLCDPANPNGPAPIINLGSGDHVVRSVPGTATGINVDGLVLGSDAGGGAMTLGPRGALPTSSVATPGAGMGGSQRVADRILSSTPRLRLTKNGRTDLRVHVDGATPGTPFWLVLGESVNAGWKATVPGAGTTGSTLADGYANGWLVNPRSATFDVALHWTPQRRVWASLLLSGPVLLLCTALVVGGVIVARRRTCPAVGTVDAGHADIDDHADLDGVPSLINPFSAGGLRAPTTVVVVAALVTAALGLVLAQWWIGLAAGALVAAVALRPRLRPLLTFTAPAALGFVALYMMADQYRHHWVSDLAWPARFTGLSQLAWLAVILVTGDAIVEMISARRRARDD